MKAASVRRALTQPLSPVRILTAADHGDIVRGGDYRYRIGDRVVDDEVYAAEDRGLLTLDRDGVPHVTDAGREWIRRYAGRRHPSELRPEFTGGEAS